MIPDSFIDELKYRLDAADVIGQYVKLKKSGRGYSGLCPFHSEKTGSFFVYPESRSFYCFGCGSGGDLVTFIRMAEHLDYMEALKMLADRAGMKLPENQEEDRIASQRKRNYEANREAARFFYKNLATEEAKKLCIPYINKRKLTPETVQKFGIGYAPDTWDALKKHMMGLGYSENELVEFDLIKRSQAGKTFDTFRNRLMFPIIDVRGMVVGFSGRALTDEQKPKYYNTNDTLAFKKSRNLFAMNLTKSTKEKNIIVCEGNIDVVSMHQSGFDNAVATLGTALSGEHVRMLANYASEIVLAYDSDEAGQKATVRANAIIAEVGLKTRVLEIKGAKDPDEFITKFGKEKFRNLLDGSSSVTEYEITKLRSKYDTTTQDGKVSFLDEFCKIVSDLESPIEEDLFIQKISTELNVSKDALKAQVKNIRSKRSHAKRKQEEKNIRIFASSPRGANYDAQREQNIRYAISEDRIIAGLMNHPDLGSFIAGKLDPEKFVTDSNRLIYSAIYDRIKNSDPFGMEYLSSVLEVSAMNRLASIVALNSNTSFDENIADELVKVILEKQDAVNEEQIGKMSSEDVAKLVSKLAQKKK